MLKAVVAILSLLLGTTCDAPATRPGASAQPSPPAPAAPPTLEPSSAEIAPSGVVQEIMAVEEAPDRHRAALRAVERSSSEDERGRLRWVAGQAALAAADWDAARQIFLRLAESDHPLAPWAGLTLGEAIAEEAPERAVALLEPLSQDDWAGRNRARSGLALASARLGDSDRAVTLYRDILEGVAPTKSGQPAAGRLAELLATRPDTESKLEALQLYRRVFTRAPLGRGVADAQRAAAAVLATLPDDARAAVARLPGEDAFARADALFRAVRHREAETAFGEIAADERMDGELRCRARLMQGKAMLRRRERDRGATHMEAVANECTDLEVRAAALFNAARAHARRNRLRAAITHYEALEQLVPNHRLADDALFRAALAARDNGDAEGLVRRLRALPERYPAGDMRGEARFSLTWELRRQARDEDDPARKTALREEAVAQLDASMQEGPGEHGEDIRGRAAYWRARLLVDLGRSPEAIDGYANIVRRWPLSYYAQQALRRIGELDADKVTELRYERPDPATLPALSFPWREEFDSAAFRRALELLRVGENRTAIAELQFLGAMGEGADPDMMWAAAAVLDAAKAYPEASRFVRRRLGTFMRTAPEGRAYHLWRIAYPDAFSPMIEEVAANEGVPPAFVRAIAREESAFDPRAVSVAHAYGLIQLIRPTAERFARDLGVSATPDALREPRNNLRIGTRFIAFLWGHYEANPALVPSAYNAGEAACDRWLRRSDGMALDEFIDSIPYDETRRYTRRVNQTYGIYTWLETGNLPPLAETLPDR
ncbi:MAG: lytic transglycosylase domain-containing protein [Myxococcota bacterium]